MERGLVLTALAAQRVFAVIHMAFRMTNLEHVPPLDATAQVVVLTAVPVALPGLAWQPVP